MNNCSTRYALLMCFIGAIFYCYEFILRVLPSVIVPNLMDTLNINATQIGMITSYYFISYTPLQIFVGTFMDHFGVRKPLTLAVFLCAVGILIFSLPKLYLAKFGMFLVGIGSAFAFVGVLKLASDWLPNKYFALASGITTSIGMVGAISGETVIAKAIETNTLGNSIIFLSIFGVILSLLTFYVIKDKKLSYKNNYFQELKKLVTDILFVIKNKQFVLNGVIGLLLYAPTTIFAGMWGVPYLQMTRNLSPHEAGGIISMIFFGWLIGGPLSAVLSNYLKKRKIILFYGALISFIIMIKLLYFPSASFIITSFFMLLLGIFTSVEILVFAVAHDIIKNELTGTAVSLTNMIVMISGLMQFTVGYLLDQAKSHTVILNKPHFFTELDYQYALAIIPIGLFLAVILSFFLRESYKS